jgi:hypothetical protein
MREQYLKQGIQKGQIQALRHLLVNIVRARYPDLAEIAQQQADHFDKPDALDLLIQQIVTAPDANTVHRLLEEDIEM